jgi:thiamine-phosphate diphosphorylase
LSATPAARDRRHLGGFYFITDSRLTMNGVLEDVRQALEAGVALVQYREKEKGFPERLQEAETLLALCRERRVPFIVDDDIGLAGEVGADGVHVGPRTLRRRTCARPWGRRLSSASLSARPRRSRPRRRRA